jgi:hypothetical protein
MLCEPHGFGLKTLIDIENFDFNNNTKDNQTNLFIFKDGILKEMFFSNTGILEEIKIKILALF